MFNFGNMTNTLKLQNQYSWLISEDVELKDLLWEHLRFRPKNYFHSSAYRQRKWDGYNDYFKRDTGRFLTGLLPEVKLALTMMKKEHQIIDERGTYDFAIKKIPLDFLQQWQPTGATPFVLHDYQAEYIEQATRFHRGLIVSPTGCHRAGQKLLMFDGSLKKVEKVVVGDQLMGPNSQPRRVLSLCRGEGQMYKISPNKGKSFVINEDHILSLVRTNDGTNKSNNVVDVRFGDYLKWSKTQKHIHKIFRSKANFSNFKDLPIDPYFLGVLIGDGSIYGVPGVSTLDEEILNVVQEQANILGLKVRKGQGIKNSCPTFFISGKKGRKNPLTYRLKQLELWGKKSGDKFIPFIYKTSSEAIRLQILAGLMDTDGHLCKGNFDFISKSLQLAQDVAFIARSLGFYSSIKQCTKSSQNGTKGTYYRQTICGDVSRIPCRLGRKQTLPRKNIKNVLRTGFSYEKLGVEKYYGFCLDGDHRYLLDDFTVTHNSGKTAMLVGILKSLPPGTPVLVMTKSVDLVRQIYDDLSKWGFPKLGRVIGGKKPICEPNTITVANVDSIHKIEKLLPLFRALIVDEVHVMMSNVPMTAYKKMKNAYVRFGLSATPFKFNGADKCQRYETKGFFGAVIRPSGGQLTTKELQDRKILSGSKCYFYPINEPELPYHTYMDAVTEGIAESLHFNETVARLAKKCKGRTLIIVERVRQGEILNQLIKGSHWVYGKDNEAARDKVKGLLQKGDKTVCIVQQALISAGINVFIHDLINTTSTIATHNIIQRMGRGLRVSEDKEELTYHDFIFNINDYLLKHSHHRIKILKEEGHNIIVKEEADF